MKMIGILMPKRLSSACRSKPLNRGSLMSKTTRQALADGVALVPGHELLLDRRNRRLQLLNLCRHGGQPQDFEASNMPSLRFRESKDPSVAEV